MKKKLFLLLCIFISLSYSQKISDNPMPGTFAHNDYDHQRPLFDALSHGFTCIEADVFLVDNELFVAHNFEDISKERTLEELYLKPLKKILDKRESVYNDGKSIYLFIDIKKDGEAVYKVLKKKLKKYKKYITTYENDKVNEKAISIVISGDRPKKAMAKDKVRIATWDGRIPDIGKALNPNLVKVISDDWTEIFDWRGEGEFTEFAKLKKYVDDIHAENKILRFWATDVKSKEVQEKAWQIFMDAGVDIINTDKLAELESFIHENSLTSGLTVAIVGDVHFDPPPESDQYYHVVAMNAVCGTVAGKDTQKWPQKIGKQKTNFSCADKKIEAFSAVALVGDITDRAVPSALELLKKRYEQGTDTKQIHFPVYVGLGNHDLDPQHVEKHHDQYKQQMLDYVAERHCGINAPVPVLNFDKASKNYSWNMKGVHFLQTHTFAGDTTDNVNSIEWLKEDLALYANDNKPVVILQHYSFDEFGLKWWSDQQRDELYNVLKNYNVIALFTGHSHYADIQKWHDIDVFQVNNAWPDNDGNGSFFICNIDENYINIMTCRWKNGEGDVEFVEPFFVKKWRE